MRDLVAANQPLVSNFAIFPAQPGTVRRPAVVIVQENLTPSEDANAVALRRAMSSFSWRRAEQGQDPERPRIGNWMNATRTWLVGRNLPAMHAAEINAAVSEAIRRARRRCVQAHRAGIRRHRCGIAHRRGGQRTDRFDLLDRTPHSLRAAVDAPVHTNLHDAAVPGLALKWDLLDLRDLIRPRSVVWSNPTDWMGNVVALGADFTYTSSDPNVSR